MTVRDRFIYETARWKTTHDSCEKMIRTKYRSQRNDVAGDTDKRFGQKRTKIFCRVCTGRSKHKNAHTQYLRRNRQENIRAVRQGDHDGKDNRRCRQGSRCTCIAVCCRPGAREFVSDHQRANSIFLQQSRDERVYVYQHEIVVSVIESVCNGGIEMMRRSVRQSNV